CARNRCIGHRVRIVGLIIGYTSAASTRILQDFDRPMVSVGYDRIRFLKPVYFGDTLTIDYVIESIERERERTIAKIEVKNQKDELVAILTHIMQLVS